VARGTALSGLAGIAAMLFLLTGDATTPQRKDNRRVKLYRNVSFEELSSYVRKGYNFGIGPESLRVKEFWLTPDALFNWQNLILQVPIRLLFLFLKV